MKHETLLNKAENGGYEKRNVLKLFWKELTMVIMNEKRVVSVCIGDEFSYALHFPIAIYYLV